MWVATNRQKPPEENAFAERARRKRHGHEEPQTAPAPVSGPGRAPEPSEVADSMPDLQALREAAERAAALVHPEAPKAAPVAQNPDSEEYVQAPDIATVSVTAAEPEKSRRGRQPSPEVQARHARVLEAVVQAEQVGITRSAVAELLEEKEQQVYTSLRHLQALGKVDVKHIEGVVYRWYAL